MWTYKRYKPIIVVNDFHFKRKPKDFNQPPLEQTLQQTTSTFDSDPYGHVEVYLYLMILDCMDVAIAKSLKIPPMPAKMKERYRKEGRDRMYHKLAARKVSLGPGGYSDLSWTGVCRLSLKTPTHL